MSKRGLYKAPLQVISTSPTLPLLLSRGREKTLFLRANKLSHSSLLLTTKMFFRKFRIERQAGDQRGTFVTRGGVGYWKDMWMKLAKCPFSGYKPKAASMTASAFSGWALLRKDVYSSCQGSNTVPYYRVKYAVVLLYGIYAECKSREIITAQFLSRCLQFPTRNCYRWRTGTSAEAPPTS